MLNPGPFKFAMTPFWTAYNRPERSLPSYSVACASPWFQDPAVALEIGVGADFPLPRVHDCLARVIVKACTVEIRQGPVDRDLAPIELRAVVEGNVGGSDSSRGDADRDADCAKNPVILVASILIDLCQATGYAPRSVSSVR